MSNKPYFDKATVHNTFSEIKFYDFIQFYKMYNIYYVVFKL
jgi:hypothetical protein